METATRLDLATLPPIRQVNLYTDLARAPADVKRTDEAVRMLVTAERVAPQSATTESAEGPRS